MLNRRSLQAARRGHLRLLPSPPPGEIGELEAVYVQVIALGLHLDGLAAEVDELAQQLGQLEAALARPETPTGGRPERT
jgi:hypothetical protein